MDVLVAKLQGRQIGERTKRLVVVAAFEDFSTGARVKEFCHNLVRDSHGQADVVEHLWLVNLLRLPQLRAIAAEDAASADVIVLSFHEAQALPDEVTSWIEMWLRLKGERQTALVALLDLVLGRDRSALQEHLRGVATQAGMEFFAQSWELTDSQR